MLRKNFPHRREERRAAAEQRSNDYAARSIVEQLAILIRGGHEDCQEALRLNAEIEMS